MGNKVTNGKPSLHNFDPTAPPPQKGVYSYTAETLPKQGSSSQSAGQGGTGIGSKNRRSTGGASSSHTKVGTSASTSSNTNDTTTKRNSSKTNTNNSKTNTNQQQDSTNKIKDPYEKFQSMFQDEMKSHLGPSKHRTFEEHNNIPTQYDQQKKSSSSSAKNNFQNKNYFPFSRNSTSKKTETHEQDEQGKKPKGFFDGRYKNPDLNSSTAQQNSKNIGSKNMKTKSSGKNRRAGEFDNPLSNIILCPGCHTPNRVPWDTKFRCYHCYAVVDPGVTKSAPDEEERLYEAALKECNIGIAVLEQKRIEIKNEVEEERQIQMAIVNSLKNQKGMLGIEKLFNNIDSCRDTIKQIEKEGNILGLQV